MHNWNNEDGKDFRFAYMVPIQYILLFLGAKMLRHIRDVLNEDVCRLFFFLSSLVVDSSYQSCLLIIDCIVLPGVASSKGQDLAESLSKLNTNVYQPVPTPEFIPVDFGDASRLPHLLNVTLTALCNCENSFF